VLILEATESNDQVDRQ